MGAARYLVLHGPATQQERWEEAAGYSPSTIASNIAALVCAASFARERGDGATAAFLEEYADFLECHVEAWMATTEGTLVPGISRHYIRILPVDVNDPFPHEDPNLGFLVLANRPPGTPWKFPAKEIVDGGSWSWSGTGSAGPTIRSSWIPFACWTPCSKWTRRTVRAGGGTTTTGTGRERMAGRSKGTGRGARGPCSPGSGGTTSWPPDGTRIRICVPWRGSASPTGLLPEQVWDEPDRPDLYMFLGRPTGSARPLMWAHAEYIKLLRSVADGKVFDLVPEVAARYLPRSRRPQTPGNMET